AESDVVWRDNIGFVQKQFSQLRLRDFYDTWNQRFLHRHDRNRQRFFESVFPCLNLAADGIKTQPQSPQFAFRANLQKEIAVASVVNRFGKISAINVIVVGDLAFQYPASVAYACDAF